MTEASYLEVPCMRAVDGAQFSQGVQDFAFSIGAPNVWYPKKSYFKITMSLYKRNSAVPLEKLPLSPAALTAFADNAAGNLYNNVYFRGGEQDISSLVQYCAQASALKVRLGNTLPWLKSMGCGVAVNEASFQKRMLAVSQYPGSDGKEASVAFGVKASLTGEGAYDERDVYRPYAGIHTNTTPENFAAASITAIDNNAGEANSPLIRVVAANTDFKQGMPLGSAPTGGSVLPGDIIVIAGVPYTISAVQDATHLILESPASQTVPAETTNWFIVRSDQIRANQAFNTVFAIWQPPIGIFDYDEALGSGNFRFQLNPNSQFDRCAVETKDPNWSADSPYRLSIDQVRFYAYVEKKSIPDSVRDLYLNEVSIQSKTYSNSLNFTVPPSTYAVSVFVQDATAGDSPLAPPSMFKVRDNGDLYLQNIQINYANTTKPSTNWASEYKVATSDDTKLTSSSILELQQRYHDTYEESGLELKLGGMETLTEWLRRGPFYHFSFERDINNKSTDLTVNTTYNGAVDGGATEKLRASRLFVVAWYRNTVQITTANGLITQVAQRAV